MFGTASQFKRVFRATLFGAVCVSISACTTRYRDHGYVPTDEELAEVSVGVDTRETVSETIGAPAASGVLSDSGYYYVSTRMRHYGATQPKIVERQVVAISFTKSGVVENIERYSLQDGRVIALNRRISDSSVQNQTFLRQLLGNIGNLSPSQLGQQ